MDTATVLEEAADLLLMRGVERGGGYGTPGGKRCVIGALGEVTGLSDVELANRDERLASWDEAANALRAHLQAAPGERVMLTGWSDDSTDDFEVVDALRLCAKNLRNQATP